MEDKIKKAIEYYKNQKEKILNDFKNRKNFSVDFIVAKGKELEEIRLKIWTLETALHN